jgi:hypothetical protein
MLPGLFITPDGVKHWIIDGAPLYSVNLATFQGRALQEGAVTTHGLHIGSCHLKLDVHSLVQVGEVAAQNGDLLIGDDQIKLRIDLFGTISGVLVDKLAGKDVTERSLICKRWKLVAPQNGEAEQTLFERAR